MSRIVGFGVLVLAAAASVSSGQQAALLAPDQRIVFLGDSNTFAGHYIAFLEASLRTGSPEKRFELINLGLPSETASGLSEPEHPFPRPTVHERLERTLDKTKPAVVFACYGMNDGIYYPFSEDHFTAYKEGINKLIDKVKGAGAKLVLITPPPLDPLPLRNRGKLRPAGSDKYAWFAIYENYDKEVLARYADWIMQQGPRVDLVIDIRTPMLKHTEQRRADKADYTMANDGIHFDEDGHRLAASAILAACGLAKQQLGAEFVKLVQQRQTLLRDAWLSQVGHKRPGVKAGLSMSDAKAKAAELDAKIRATQ